MEQEFKVLYPKIAELSGAPDWFEANDDERLNSLVYAYLALMHGCSHDAMQLSLVACVCIIVLCGRWHLLSIGIVADTGPSRDIHKASHSSRQACKAVDEQQAVV